MHTPDLRVTGPAELTEPFATLLADDLTERVLAEVQRIKAGAKAPKARKRPVGAPSDDDISMYLKLAGLTGQRSKHDPVWHRIRELHRQRFGGGQQDALPNALY
jgi:hypothetical protein